VGVEAAEIPPEATELAGRGVLDCVGVTLAGSRTAAAAHVRELVEEMGGRPDAAVLGTALRTSPALAALANGTAAHALDFDDTNHPAYSHPSCHLLPALLALGEREGSSGSDLLAAYLVGFELEVRAARAVNMPHYLAGWHATATLGTLGATAACARLLGLDAGATAHALGIAASLAGGLRQNFGTMTKPLHAGLAARGGVEAALLGRRGLTASAEALDGRYGFCSVLDGGGPADLAELEPERFGRPWEITEPYGLAIKQFPSCGATHPAIEAALELVHEDGVRPGEIERVRVGTNELAPRILVYERPASGLEGKFSLHYCVATALVEGRVGLDHFDDGGVREPAVRELIERIDARVDDRVRDDPEHAAIVAVELKGGGTRERRVDLAKGKTSRPLSPDELARKYADCAGRVLPEAAVESSRRLLERLDRVGSVALVVDALRPE
jgi:2-methylcitrate dehydratase PrpD